MLRILVITILFLVEHSYPFSLPPTLIHNSRITQDVPLDSRVNDADFVYYRYQPIHAIRYTSFHLKATANSNRQKSTQLPPKQEEYLASLNNEVYGGAFIERLRDLQEYKNTHGSCIVPKRYTKNPTLGNWVNKQRQMYKKFKIGEKSSMTQPRIDILDNMGFLWVAGGLTGSDGQLVIGNAQLWMERYSEIKSYIIRDDGTKLSSHKALCAWVVGQRREYLKYEMGEKTSLTEERVKLLDSIGFDWSPYETKWNLRVMELAGYKEKFGDCLVPINYEENEPLGRWVSTQRKYFKAYMSGKSKHISQARIKQLDKLGFIWNCRDYNMDKWNSM